MLIDIHGGTTSILTMISVKTVDIGNQHPEFLEVLSTVKLRQQAHKRFNKIHASYQTHNISYLHNHNDTLSVPFSMHK